MTPNFKKKKWKRYLNASKRKQGISTPPAPQHKKRRKEWTNAN